MYLWRAVDNEGEVLDVLVQRKRDKRAALKLMRKLLKKQGCVPDAIVTDKLRSYSAALRELGLSNRHVTGGRSNNRTENSHQPGDDESERAKALALQDLLNVFFPSTPPSTTTSTSSAT